MDTKKKLPITLIVMAIWILSVLLTIPVIQGSITSNIHAKVKDAELVLASTASKIEYSINSRLLNLRTLEVLIRHDGGMLCDFEDHASAIYEADPCVRCIQLAPNGVITHIYPLEGNENAFGNLFVNELRKDEARHAMETGEMTLGGPYELHRGGVGVVARRPIYMETDAGESFFWGLAIEVMDLPVLLETVETEALKKSGYSYRIWHCAPQTGAPTVFAGNEQLPDIPLTAEISVPGSVWHLSLVPTAGWFSTKMRLSGISIFIAFNLLTLILAFIYVRLSKSKERLKSASITDQLTGMNNSRSFYEFLDVLSSKQTPCYIYYMDINKFKDVNDTYGHGVGNIILRSFAQRIHATTTATTMLFRIGGDEFAIVKYGSNPSEARKYKEELLAALSTPFSADGLVLSITSSIGYANYPLENSDIEKVLRLAESRMYEEKARISHPVALNSRISFFSALDNRINELIGQNPDQSFYFFHIDYKNFKLINYKYGVDAGDELIKHTVTFINNLPECVLCSRGYADAVFFVTKEPSSVCQSEIEEKYLAYYDSFIDKEQNNFHDICLSVNCGCCKILGTDLKNAAGCANIGRILSKRRFDTKPVFVDLKQAATWIEERSLESGAHLAARQKKIFYELQPIISTSENKMVFAEALGRLKDKNNRVIPPNVFVPILTKTGDIVPFDLHILNCVCHDIRARIDAGKPIVPISVNLSPLHLEDANTPEKIRQILETHRVSPDMICIEITEDLLISDIQKLLNMCNALHEIGIKILLDDFGAGYLNFETLRILPIDTLKIDRSLISAKSCNPKDVSGSIVSMIMSISNDMNIPVICEGIENQEQFQWLHELGASYLQGFYFSHPSLPDEVYDKFI